MDAQTPGRGLKILSVSFWVVIIVHLIVFTSVGLFTDLGWRMLLIFVVGAPVVIFIKRIVLKYFTNHSKRRITDNRNFRSDQPPNKKDLPL